MADRIIMPTQTILVHARPNHSETEMVEMYNKEMEELLKVIENNKELKKLYENSSINSKGVENEKERN